MILFVNQSAGYLVRDIIEQYLQDDIECCLITGGIGECEFSSELTIVEAEKYDKRNMLSRFVSWVLFTKSFFMYFYRNRASIEQIVCFSNPPTVQFLLPFLNVKYHIVVFDLYPDAMLTLGKGVLIRLIFKIWSLMLPRQYNRSDSIVVLSPRVRDQILQINKDLDSRIRVMSLWPDPLFRKRIPSIISKKFKISENTKLVYAGNMGLTHPLEVLVVQINDLGANVSLDFIGDGDKRKKLENMTKYAENVTFFDFMSVDQLVLNLSSADFLVVALNYELPSISVPSKFFNYLLFYKPILFLGHRQSELARYIVQFNIGAVVDENYTISNVIDDCKAGVLSFEDSSFKAALEYFSADNIHAAFEGSIYEGSFPAD